MQIIISKHLIQYPFTIFSLGKFWTGLAVDDTAADSRSKNKMWSKKYFCDDLRAGIGFFDAKIEVVKMTWR